MGHFICKSVKECASNGINNFLGIFNSRLSPNSPRLHVRIPAKYFYLCIVIKCVNV